MQPLEPRLFEYWPEGHKLQASAALSLLKLPRGQGV